MPQSIRELYRAGQSVWLDFIRRRFIDSGGLDRYVRDGWISGLTSNPSIFAKAVSGSNDYRDGLLDIAREGVDTPYDAFVQLAVDDIQRAADILHPIYHATAGRDGFVSLEVPPGIEHDPQKTIAEAQRLFRLVDRPNAMIKVPGTAAGIQALEELIVAGLNINVTLLFDVTVYEAVARAYLAGLERRLEDGQPLADVASVASFFVSRIDTAVDAELPEASPLRGAAAVANAHFAYSSFRQIFAGTALGAAGRRRRTPAATALGLHQHQESGLLGRPLR